MSDLYLAICNIYLRINECTYVIIITKSKDAVILHQLWCILWLGLYVAQPFSSVIS